MRGLPIRTELSAAELRALAWRETRPRVAPRLYAIAHVLDGVSQAGGAAVRHGPPGAARRGDALQRRGSGRPGGSAPAQSRAAAERGRAGGASRADPAGATPGAERPVELDPGRPVPGGRGELGQALPSCQHVARRVSPRVLSSESATGPPAIRRTGAGGVRKKPRPAKLAVG